MPKLPRLTAREICSVLEKVGFSIARQSGSHIIYKNAEGKRATVPFHAAKDRALPFRAQPGMAVLPRLKTGHELSCPYSYFN